MQFSLIVRNSNLRKTEGTRDIGVDGEKIVKIAPHIDAKAAKEIDASGRLVVPTFIDPHIHLDKTTISEEVRDNVSGNLQEAIEIIWDKKRHYTHEEIIGRASRVIESAIVHGTTVIRTHVDVDSIGKLIPVEALAQVKKKYASCLDLQIVAFPQEGIFQDEESKTLLRQALEKGADVIGGMPHNEMTYDDSKAHIDFVFSLAKEFNVDIDMHVDETDDPYSRTLEYLAAKTIKEKYFRRVTADHTCALSAYDNYHAAKVIGLVKKAEMNMITNPATNLMLQGRQDRGNIRRGLTRVKELLAAQVNVCFGQDCIKDTFYPTFGQADLLEVAFLLAHAAQFTLPQEIETLMDMPTFHAARTLRLENYGLQEGAWASFNVLDAPNIGEAFRTRRPRPYVVRKGKILAQSRMQTEMFLPSAALA